MKPTTIAVDVATDSLEVAVSNRAGRVTERHRLPRSRVLPFFRKQGKATVLLEACASAHHWARQLQALGHHVVLLPPTPSVPTSPGTRPTRPTPRRSWRPSETRTSIPSP